MIARKPDAVAAEWNKSLICLGSDALRKAGRSTSTAGPAPRAWCRAAIAQPRWNGGRVDGTLLVWGEQGLGDEILHASMLPRR